MSEPIPEISPLIASSLTDEERALPVDANGCYEKYGIKFHELSQDHLEVLRHWRNHPDIQQFMVFREEISPEMQQQWFRDIARKRELHLESYAMLEYRGEIVGMTQLKKIDYPYRRAEGGIIIFRPEHQNGLIPYRVAIGGMDSDFLHRGLETMTATIRKMNSRARRFTKSLGYELVDPDPAGDILLGTVRVVDYFRAAKKFRPLLASDDDSFALD